MKYEFIKELKKKRLSKKINICIIVFGECVELRRGGGGCGFKGLK